MTSLSPSASSLSSDDMASSLTGGQRTSPTNSLNSDMSGTAGVPVMPELKLHCTICSETFRNPKVLQCLHSFCASCLDNLVSQEGSDRIQCPECHLISKLPPSGVSGLLPDFGMIRMLNPTANPSGFPTPADRCCTSCKGTNKLAEAQCIDCANSLCANCVVAHQLMHCFHRHRVYPLTDFRTNFGMELGLGGAGEGKFTRYDAFGRLIDGKPVVTCPNHPTERLEMFCVSCDIPVCKDCLFMEHPKGQHEVVSIQDVAQREISILHQMKERAQAKAEELAANSSEASLARFAGSFQTAQAAIEDTYQFYIQVLKERREELLQNLKAMYNEHQHAISPMQEKNIECSRRLTSICHFMERLLAYASEAEILLFKRQLTHLVDSVFTAYSDNSGLNWTSDVIFLTNYQQIQSNVQNSFGSIQKKSENPLAFRNGSRTLPVGTRSIPSVNGDVGLHNGINAAGSNNTFPFPPSTTNSIGSLGNIINNSGDRSLPAPIGVKRTSPSNSGSMYPFANMDSMANWLDGTTSSPSSLPDQFFGASSLDETLTSQSDGRGMNPARPNIRRLKMAYVAKFGDFGTGDGQFSEPSGVAVNAQRDILVADTNNHRVQIFDHEGRFKFAFGECGKRDGQMLYPNRVAVARNGDVVVTERSPTHQIQVYNQYGAFVRKFGADILQHPRGITVDNRGRVIVVECKVMRVVIFEPNGRIYNKFACSQHLEFPNGVATNDNEEIFISDNRAHCVKVFNYHGIYLRQIGGEGVTNFPIGVCITERGHVIVADNHNNFNLTIFRQDGSLVSAYESRVKHAQCFDVTLMDEGSVVLASKDYKVYVYRFANFGNNFPMANDILQHGVNSINNNIMPPLRTSTGLANIGMNLADFHLGSSKNLVKLMGGAADFIG